jgi:hypothetical protein
VEEYQNRIIEEKDELDVKLKKLKIFLNSDVFTKLSYDEQIRLRLQKSFMLLYFDILVERIKYANI